MAKGYVVGISQIERRRKALSSETPKHSSLYLKEVALNSLKNDSPTTANDIRHFISESSNLLDANSNGYEILKFLQKLNRTPFYEMAASMVAKEVVPFVDNLNGFLKIVEQMGYDEDVSRILKEAVYDNKIVDGILDGHAELSKHFDADRYIKENYHLPLKVNVLELCSAIDNIYTKVPKVGRFLSTLSESMYLLDKAGKKYDRKEVVQYVTEYYLNSEKESTESEIDWYRKALKETFLLTKSDLENVKWFIESAGGDIMQDDDFSVEYLTDDDPVVSKRDSSVMELLNQFKASPDKREETFFTFIDALNSLPKRDVVLHFKDIMTWMTDYAITELYEIRTVINGWKKIVASLIDSGMSNAECDKCIESINFIIETLSTRDWLQAGDTTEIVSALQKTIDAIKDYDSIRGENIPDDEDSITMKLEDFMVSSVYENIHNLTEACKETLRESELGDTIYNNTKTLLFSGKNFKSIRENNESILDCITEEGMFDHCIGMFDIAVPDEIPVVKDAADKVCKKISNMSAAPTTHMYFESLDSLIELHIYDTNIIGLSEAQEDEWDRTFTESELTYFGLLNNLNETLDMFETIDGAQLMENFSTLEPDLNADQICGIIELSEYLGGMISKERLDVIAENYYTSHPDDYLGNSAIKSAIGRWSLQELDMSTVAEAVGILNETLLNEVDFKVKSGQNTTNKNGGSKNGGQDSTKSGVTNGKKDGVLGKIHKTVPSNGSKSASVSDKETKHEEKKEKENKKDKISFNTLKLALVALKKKAKNMDTKAEKWSREVDMQAEQFIKAVKDLYTNDRREGIIKGSVIPSFHKLFQRTCVGAAGMAAIAIFNPTAAVYSAALYVFSLIAMSKHNNMRERALMLDEIDIELDALEKELSMAESNGNMKKYRRLATYQKKLQREKARIKYRVSYKSMVLSHDLPDK